LPDEGGGKAEATDRLEGRGKPEDLSGKKMDFVVNDQAPRAGVEGLKMDELIVPVLPRCKDLVCRDGYGPDLLSFTAVLAHRIDIGVRFVEQFPDR
jgi:hypothetical protein